jgi:hypothetical protein
VFQVLSQRPLRLPSIRKGDPCLFSGAVHLRGIPAEAALGPGTGTDGLDEGPVYLAFPAIPRNLDLLPPTREGWRNATILVVSRESYGGPVLLRGGRLDERDNILFPGSSGKERMLRLPSGEWDEQRPDLSVWGRTVSSEPGWRLAIADVLFRTGGCYGLRLDGSSFSYVILFSATWQG